MRDLASYGILLWCVLIFFVGLWYSQYTAHWYHVSYKKQKEEAKEKDSRTTSAGLSEEQKLAKASCPFADLLDNPEHMLSKEFEDDRVQEQCPVTGYVTPMPMLADKMYPTTVKSLTPPTVPQHPSQKGQGTRKKKTL